jgi:hypothetical protein
MGQPPPTVGGGDTHYPPNTRTTPNQEKADPRQETGKAMDDDFSAMNDPDFLAERTRVRETIEALTERLTRLDDEFIRRAAARWQEATQ